LYRRKKQEQRSRVQTSGSKHRPPLKEWSGLQAVVEEAAATRCVAEAEVEEAAVEVVAEAGEDRLSLCEPWQPGEEWDARKYPCLARNSARNNQIPLVNFFPPQKLQEGAKCYFLE
jgi:hypothetical protein